MRVRVRVQCVALWCGCRRKRVREGEIFTPERAGAAAIGSAAQQSEQTKKRWTRKKKNRPRAGADNESSRQKSWIGLGFDWIRPRSDWRGLDQTGLDSNRNCRWAGCTEYCTAPHHHGRGRRGGKLADRDGTGLDRLVVLLTGRGSGCDGAGGRNWGRVKRRTDD